MKPTFPRGLALLVTAMFAVATPALAYDGDTHYAWTYYLAIHVGYSPRQAYQIASAAWAIDHDPETGPLHATPWDSVSGAPGAAIERVWRRFHAFADKEVVGRNPNVDAVSARRREGEELLAAIGVRQRNIGAQIHYLQDYFAHNEYDSVRGHAVWGHAPDRIGHGTNRARTMTKKTIEALTRFAPSVGVTPRVPDENRLWEVLDRLSRANPPLLQLEPANYDLVWDAIISLDLERLSSGVVSNDLLQASIVQLGVPRSIKQTLGLEKIAWGDVDLDAAVDVINHALVEDLEVARVRRFPADWTLPHAWIQYDFDADGAATPAALSKNHFTVEKLAVTFGNAKVAFRRDPSSASLYEVTVEQPYTIQGMATLPAFRAIPVVERSVWSDDAEQIQKDRDRTNGTFVMERKVFRPRAALLDGSLKWKPSIDLFGDATVLAPEVPIRFRPEYDWFVVALSGAGFDLQSAGVVTSNRGQDVSRTGLHRRRGSADLAILKVERGSGVAAAVADIRKIVAEPHCRRVAAIPATDALEASSVSLGALPQYWEDLALEVRGPFASRNDASLAMKPARWEDTGFDATPNLTEIEFRFGCRAQVIPTPHIAVPNVAGLRADAAEERLRGAGLNAMLVAGAAPRTREEQYTIEWQEPVANAAAALGSRVRIAVRPAFVEPAHAVPSVAGFAAGMAEQRLKEAGFVPRLAGGDPAPSADRAFTVQDQRPAGGETAAPGSTVVVRVFSRADTGRAIPNVIGLPAAAAERRLTEVGLVAVPVGGDPAPSSGAAFTVQSQQPAAGMAAEAGARVQVRIHSAFAQAPPPRSEPTPVPAAGVASGDPNVFRCPSFGNRSLPPTRLRPNERTARCPANTFDFYSYGGRDVAVRATWTAGPPPQGWTGACGRQPEFKFIPTGTTKNPFKNLQTGEMTYYDRTVPAFMSGALWGSQRLALASLQWWVDSYTPMPPELIELARQVLAEAEWRGRPCGEAAPPNAPTPPPPPQPPPPVRQVPSTPSAPADNRPPCTCTDSSGRHYRMMFGVECDPTGSGRDDKCRP